MVGYVLITWVSGSGRADLGLRGSLRPRYQQVLAHRTRYCDVLHRAVGTLSQGRAEGEDHIDAISLLAKSVETCLSAYGMLHTTFTTLDKAYARLRE